MHVRRQLKKDARLKVFNERGFRVRKEYDLSKMKLKANPYASKLKRSVTIRIDEDVIEYFKKLSEKTGTPYQRLMNEFLKSCKEQRFRPETVWKKAG